MNNNYKAHIKEEYMTEEAQYHVFGGGTVFHVRSHFAIAAIAYGSAAKFMAEAFAAKGLPSVLHLTKMADSNSKMETNKDVGDRLNNILEDRATKAIILSAALCDFEAKIGDVEPGWHADRLQSRDGQITIDISPQEKLLNRIHEKRSDICIVGFKTTTNKTMVEQFEAAKRQITESKVTFVLANDVVTRVNMIVSADAQNLDDVFASTDRKACLQKLVDAVADNVQARSNKSSELKYG